MTANSSPALAEFLKVAEDFLAASPVYPVSFAPVRAASWHALWDPAAQGPLHSRPILGYKRTTHDRAHILAVGGVTGATIRTLRAFLSEKEVRTDTIQRNVAERIRALLAAGALCRER